MTAEEAHDLIHDTREARGDLARALCRVLAAIEAEPAQAAELAHAALAACAITGPTD